jgi:hypothetical protein
MWYLFPSLLITRSYFRTASWQWITAMMGFGLSLSYCAVQKCLIKKSKTDLVLCSVATFCMGNYISRFKRFAYKRVKCHLSVWLDNVLNSLFQLRIWGQSGQELRQQTHRNLYTIKRYFRQLMKAFLDPKPVILFISKAVLINMLRKFLHFEKSCV